ncbi:MAG TPA: hypothetical protein VHR45_06610 [Thermoanaerobaculia bacterium]|nr:hypothetical protein [Thermoanaerobaculia bacterium]
MSGRLLFWPLLLALCLALGWQTLRLRSRLLASQLVRQVELISLAAAPSGPAAMNQVLPVDLALLRRAAAADPAAVEVPLARAAQFMLVGRPQDAIASYLAAIELEPHPEIYLLLGRAQLEAGDPAAARRNFELAVRLDPSARDVVPPGGL